MDAPSEPVAADDCDADEVASEPELLLDDPSPLPVSAVATAAPPSSAAPIPRVMAPALNHIRTLGLR
ncbi:hypothetical protein [Mycolicibacterium sp. 050158]|uniref:hypothetical protein n=1 Tax=Mycolicibacterium sp. 050158 TaxID=3090602 RepID=UPI00299EF98E|nr:hypothetical protein [Mycolicibacterium sp. 050158]MDX1892797.1 hypothetical protein [Mycolicibacterium sp. 050158]